MIENDTVKLLRECDAGIKMGIWSIDDVLSLVEENEFKEALIKCKDEHEELKDEVSKLLCKYNESGKEPNPVAKGMSWMKTNIKLQLDKNDKTIADVMTDGCNMGVKSLNRYLNQYEAADEKSKDIAKKLIKLEGELSENIRSYL